MQAQIRSYQCQQMIQDGWTYGQHCTFELCLVDALRHLIKTYTCHNSTNSTIFCKNWCLGSFECVGGKMCGCKLVVVAWEPSSATTARDAGQRAGQRVVA
jgi:hypothetical protein